MKAAVALLLIGFPLLADAADAASAGPLRARLTGDAIRQAVREVLDENPGNPRGHEADTIRGNKYQAFGEQFDEARVPDCLHPDGLKRQPTGIGPIALAGLLAAPFVVVAKARGKCN